MLDQDSGLLGADQGQLFAPTPSKGHLEHSFLFFPAWPIRDPCKRSCPPEVLAPPPSSRVHTRLGHRSVAPSCSPERKVCPQIPFSAKPAWISCRPSGSQRSAFWPQPHGRVSGVPAPGRPASAASRPTALGWGPEPPCPGLADASAVGTAPTPGSHFCYSLSIGSQEPKRIGKGG